MQALLLQQHIRNSGWCLNKNSFTLSWLFRRSSKLGRPTHRTCAYHGLWKFLQRLWYIVRRSALE